MKRQLWIKWLTGVSGALLFTGFIGYINHSDALQSDDSVTAASGYTQTQNQDTDTGTAIEQRGQRREGFGAGFGRNESGLSGSDDSQSDGQLRTRAS